MHQPIGASEKRLSYHCGVTQGRAARYQCLGVDRSVSNILLSCHRVMIVVIVHVPRRRF